MWPIVALSLLSFSLHFRSAGCSKAEHTLRQSQSEMMMRQVSMLVAQLMRLAQVKMAVDVALLVLLMRIQWFYDDDSGIIDVSG